MEHPILRNNYIACIGAVFDSLAEVTAILVHQAKEDFPTRIKEIEDAENDEDISFTYNNDIIAN